MRLVRFKHDAGTFKKGGVYLFDNANAATVPPHIAESIPFSEMPVFNGQPNLFIPRSGGIGDIIAYSCLCEVANITFMTQPKYFPFFDYWQRKPQLKGFQQPLFMVNSIDHLRKVLLNWGRIDDDAIELGSTQNWYTILYTITNSSGELRPKLKPVKRPLNGRTLIVYKSSVIDRTADLGSIIAGIPNDIDWDVNTETTTGEYIERLLTYSDVITTDTSAIHFREGMELPALGIFGAIHKDSRTSGYRFTTSVQSPICAPCYRHSRKPCQFNTGTYYAPCLTGQPITDLIKQYYAQKEQGHSNTTA